MITTFLQKPLQTRVFFGQFSETVAGRSYSNGCSIRVHSLPAAFLLRLLSLLRLASGIVTVTFNARVLYLNKGSFDGWCRRNGVDPEQLLTVEEKIKKVLENFFPSSFSSKNALSSSQDKGQQERLPLSSVGSNIEVSNLPSQDSTIQDSSSQNSSSQNLPSQRASIQGSTSQDSSNPCTIRLIKIEPISAHESAELKAKKEAELKAKKEAEVQRAAKVAKIASEVFDDMLAMFYLPDGQLNSEWQKHQILMRYSYTPTLERDADDPNIEKYKERGEKRAKECLESISQTHFPLQIDGQSYPFESFVQEETETIQADLYHGTDPESVKDILEKGFDIYKYNNPDVLTAGHGVYIGEYEVALSYAKNRKEGVVACRLKPGLKLIRYKDVHTYFVKNDLYNMASLFVKRQRERLQARFKELGDAEDFDKSTYALSYALTNRFVAVFFQKLGYAGVTCKYNGYAGTGFTCIFNPNDLEFSSLTETDSLAC